MELQIEWMRGVVGARAGAGPVQHGGRHADTRGDLGQLHEEGKLGSNILS